MNIPSKTIITTCIFLFFATTTLGITPTPSMTPTPKPLPQGYNWHHNPENGHYYTLDDQAKTWEEAKILAESLGGYLGTVTSQNEQNFISTFANGKPWIGLLNVDNEWSWITNEEFSYNNFDEDFTSKSFVRINFFSNQGQWQSEDEIKKSNTLIEFVPDNIVIPPPTPTPTPTPTPPNLNLLTGESLEDNNLSVGAVSGFRQGKVEVVELPDAPSADAKGLEVTLGPGQGVWINSTEMASASSLAQVSAVLKASDKNISFAVVALNSPVDGQIAYTNISGDEVPTSQYRTLNLFYDPPANGLQVALQVVNSPFATVSSKVWIDQFRVDTVQPIADGERVETQVDGSFEHGLEDLITNINDADGSITPFFESLTDIALRLEIGSDQFAANIGTSLLNLEGQFPMQLLGEVNVKREMSMGNGMLAFVLTNGFQSIGLFRNIDQIPLANDQNSETIILGGDFNVANPSSPVMVFVQNGGQNAPSSIVIDDLRVIRK